MSLRRFASQAGALLVAAIAAPASYTHMRTVALHYGQPPLIAALLPVSVDGLMATARVALGDGRGNRWSAWLAFWTGVSASVLANVLAAGPQLVARPSRRTRRPIGQTRDLVAKLRAQNPQISQAELARRLGISATRLRQIDQAEVRPEHPRPINDHDAVAHTVSPQTPPLRARTAHGCFEPADGSGESPNVEGRVHPMQVSAATQHAAARQAPPPAQAPARQAGGATQVTPQAVSAAVLQRAVGDGDGRTGAAALNDGDAAALAAAQQVKSEGRTVDVKA